MPGHDIVVIGASAGGVEALAALVSVLPPDLPAALFVVVHFPPDGTSVLPDILNRRGTLEAVHAQDGQPIEHGKVYVAPPNKHLIVKRGHIRTARGPRENGHRPAVDPLFRTAARAYGPRVIGVILSGTLDDGTVGSLVVKQQGGKVVVQDPDDALYSGMPRSVMDHVEVDEVVPLSELGDVLARVIAEPVTEGEPPMDDETEMEADMAELEMAAMQSEDRPGHPSGFACPDCGGALFELTEDRVIRFRCRVGHAFTGGSLLSKQSQNLEDALWVALRALEESASLSHRMLNRALDRGHTISAHRFRDHMEQAKEQAAVIRNFLLADGETLSESPKEYER